jgi:hypothetical protein
MISRKADRYHVIRKRLGRAQNKNCDVYQVSVSTRAWRRFSDAMVRTVRVFQANMIVIASSETCTPTAIIKVIRLIVRLHLLQSALA